MINVKIDSLQEFHEAVLSWGSRHPLFRGQKSCHYKLLSKFGRGMAVDPKNNIGCEKATLKEFIRRGRPYLNSVPSDQWEWLAVAQHHGLHTRLLDWTSNPLVAAYFSALMHDFDKDATIHVFDDSALPDASRFVSPFEITDPCVFRPDHTTPRIIAQSGLFTVQPDPSVELEVDGMERWTIANGILTQLMMMVQIYGVDHASMFPGLEGLCRDIDEWHVRGSLYF